LRIIGGNVNSGVVKSDTRENQRHILAHDVLNVSTLDVVLVSVGRSGKPFLHGLPVHEVFVSPVASSTDLLTECLINPKHVYL
jgi:hypothetical protein